MVLFMGAFIEVVHPLVPQAVHAPRFGIGFDVHWGGTPPCSTGCKKKNRLCMQLIWICCVRGSVAPLILETTCTQHVIGFGVFLGWYPPPIVPQAVHAPVRGKFLRSLGCTSPLVSQAVHAPGLYVLAVESDFGRHFGNVRNP